MKGNYGNIQWADQAQHRHYLVTWGVGDSGDEHAPFGLASMSEIVDKIATEAFQSALGEGSDDVIAAWRLTDYGPVPVDITYQGHEGSVTVIFTWTEPQRRGRKITDTGYYVTPEV